MKDHLLVFAVASVIGAFSAGVPMGLALHRVSQEARAYRCQLELIDPIRAEAGVPLSEDCKCWLKGK